MSEAESLPADHPPPQRADGGTYEFPGCRPIRIPRSEIADYDGALRVLGGSHGNSLGSQRTDQPVPRVAVTAACAALGSHCRHPGFADRDLWHIGPPRSGRQGRTAQHPPSGSDPIPGPRSLTAAWACGRDRPGRPAGRHFSKWISPPTSAEASSLSTSPGGSRRSGWMCRTSARLAPGEIGLRS